MRELHAVDSEHKKNEQNDAHRIAQVCKSLSVAGHVWTKFGTGNIMSLTEAGRKLEESVGVNDRAAIDTSNDASDSEDTVCPTVISMPRW